MRKSEETNFIQTSQAALSERETCLGQDM